MHNSCRHQCTHTETERETERQRETATDERDRDRQRDSENERDTERQRETHTQTHEAKIFSTNIFEFYRRQQGIFVREIFRDCLEIFRCKFRNVCKSSQ